MSDDIQIKAHYFFIPMNNNTAASVCINTLVLSITTFQYQKPLSEAYNNQCYLVQTIECGIYVETIECVAHDLPNKNPKQL